jgi:hypothetical protein
MDDDKNPAPAGWLESLAISEAQLAQGKIVPAEPIFQRLRDSIERLEAVQARSPRKHRAASRR